MVPNDRRFIHLHLVVLTGVDKYQLFSSINIHVIMLCSTCLQLSIICNFHQIKQHCILQTNVSSYGFIWFQTRKMYTPARTAPRYPYTQWPKICETLTLRVQDLGPNPYTLTGTSPHKGYPLWCNCYSNVVYLCNGWRIALKIPPILCNFYILHSPWHKPGKNLTLSDTHLLFKTLPLVAPVILQSPPK